LKISTTLIVFCIGISLFATLVGFAAIIVSQEDLQKVIGDNLLLESKHIMDKIDRDFSVKILESKSYSKNSDLREFLIISNNEFSQFEDVSQYINEKDKEWVSTSNEELNPFMKNILENKISKQLKDRLLFYEHQYAFPVFGEIFVTNAYGANIAQTGKTSDYKQDDESWWQNTKELGVYAENIKYDEISDIHSVNIGIRIDDEDGNFLGVMKIVMSINEIIRTINEAEVLSGYDTSKMGLFFSNGKMIYDAHMPNDINMAAPPFFDFVNSEKGVFKFNPQIMPEQLFAYTTQVGYGEFSGFGWIFVNHLDTAEIFYEANQQRNIILLVMASATIVSMSSGIIISRSISKPISELKKTTSMISEGRYESKINEGGPEEISSLSRSFNKMSKEIILQRDNLIKKEKMASLEKLNEAKRKKIEEVLLDTIPCAVTTFDQNGIFVDCNQFFLDKIGFSKDELIGKRAPDFITKEDQKRYGKTITPSLINEKPLMDLDLHVEKKDGNIFHSFWNHIRISGNNNEYLGFTAIGLDLTEIDKLRDELVKKEKMATLGNFSSRLAHDLRNPLSIIMTSLENLKSLYGTDDTKQRHFDKVERSINRMVHQVDDVLNFVKEQPTTLTKTKTSEIILESLDSLVIPSRIKLILSENDVDITCDKEQFVIALNNLILNAIQAIDGLGTIEISVEENNDEIIIQVKDSGKEIPKEELDILFEPLFTTKQHGTGLGLSSVKSIIQAHGGTVSVTSPPVIFTITIPKVHD